MQSNTTQLSYPLLSMHSSIAAQPNDLIHCCRCTVVVAAQPNDLIHCCRCTAAQLNDLTIRHCLCRHEYSMQSNTAQRSNPLLSMHSSNSTAQLNDLTLTIRHCLCRHEYSMQSNTAQRSNPLLSMHSSSSSTAQRSNPLLSVHSSTAQRSNNPPLSM